MKYPICTFVALLYCLSMSAQAPQGFNYQAIAHDTGGEIIEDQTVGIQLSILQSSIDGLPVYIEEFTPTTNHFGLLVLEVGKGTVVSGDFSGIDWSSDSYFMKVEIDPAGGTEYISMGTSQLLSVPYAMHAKTVENFTEIDPLFGTSIAGGITGTDTAQWNNKLDNEAQNLADVLTIEADAGSNPILNVSQMGIGTSSPDSCAILEINSTTQGVLLPRMTLDQREEIIPVAGLIIFNTTSAKPNFYDGTEWKHFDGTSAALTIGDFYQGGILFHLDETGKHGLVCAVSDESAAQEWGCWDTNIVAIPDNCDLSVLNQPGEDGLAFSNAVVTECGTNTAAGICRAKTTGAYADWYLPTGYELNLMYLNKSVINAASLVNGGSSFSSTYYWSSSECTKTQAWMQNWSDGYQSANIISGKKQEFNVRAIRAF